MSARRPPRLSGAAGFALTELMVVMTISIVILGAVLTTFQLFDRTARRNQVLVDSEDHTRVATDQLARELRNLASPTPEQPQAVEVAGPYDLVFQTVDASSSPTGANLANVRRVRYCLDAPAQGNATFWSQSQTWSTATAPPMPSTASCPNSAWGNQLVMAQGVTNRADGQNRPLFQFNSATFTQISAIVTQLWTQTSGAPGNPSEPADGLLRTQVFLRNQNQPPTAGFDARATGLLHVLLNASASADPEGGELVYKWYDGGTYVGSGIVFDLRVASPGTHTITLKAFDPAGLEGDASQTVNVL